jgi:hypothetical protein
MRQTTTAGVRHDEGKATSFMRHEAGTYRFSCPRQVRTAMLAKASSLILLTLALLGSAIVAPARADQQQYVVAYLEFLPAFKEVGGNLLEQLVSIGRHAKGLLASTPNRKFKEVTSSSWSQYGKRPLTV